MESITETRIVMREQREGESLWRLAPDTDLKSKEEFSVHKTLAGSIESRKSGPIMLTWTLIGSAGSTKTIK